MDWKRLRPTLALIGLALVLAACGSDTLQLPQPNQRLQQQRGTTLLERKVGRIVYVGNDGNIYVTDQGGISNTAITSDASLSSNFYHQYRWPTWSPDSSQVAFVGESGTLDDPTTVDTVLYTVSRDGGVLTEAFVSGQTLPYYLYWSPDGKYLSFLAINQTERTIELQAVSADGSSRDSVRLAQGTPLYLAWAPDGNSVLMHIDSEQPDAVLGEVQLGESPSTGLDLAEFPYSPAVFQAPAWSPDGSMLLFATAGEGGTDRLVVTDAQGQGPRVVAEYEGKIAFGWSPDSRYVAYIVSGQSTLAQGPSLGVIGSLHLFDLKRNEATTLVEDEEVLAFFWSPNSRRLAYFVPRLVAAEDTGTQTIALGLKVANTRSGDSKDLFEFLPPDDFLQMLSFFDQFQRSATLWSPDSQYILFAVQQDTPLIAVMHASGAVDPRGIGEGTLAFWSWD